MSTATFEIVSGTLFVTGSLDRGTDDELTKALEQYAQHTPATNRIVDMSNVRWLSPSGAKVIIAAGQDAGEKGGSMRILASRHVLQTLNLLGAKTWLTIESCLTPNAKPHPETEDAPPPPPPPPPAPAPKAAAPAAKAEGAPKAESAPAAAAAPAAPAAPAAAEQAPPAAISGTMAAVGRATGALAGPHEELSRGGQLLRVLHPNRRYSFHFAGGELILGLVRERVGGSWVIVETAGTRKIINLDLIEYCEIL